MKKITEMELCMENMETIKLLPHEFSNCEIGNIVEAVALTSAGMMQFQSTDAASFTMKSSANHTYNSFGHASQKTIFARFEECPIIGCIRLFYDDGSMMDVFIPDTSCYDVSVDDYGNMTVGIYPCCVELDDENPDNFCDYEEE